MVEEPFSIVWSAYLQYRATQRGYDLARIEEIVRYSDERYFDTVTRRVVVVGKHEERVVVIPIEREADSITPVTIHATTRQQIRFRLRSGRFIHE